MLNIILHPFTEIMLSIYKNHITTIMLAIRLRPFTHLHPFIYHNTKIM